MAAPGYAQNPVNGYVNSTYPNDELPNKINTANGRFILRNGDIKNIYGVSDNTLKKIIIDIKLQILRSMSGIPTAQLPTTRAEFITTVSTHFNLITQGAHTLNTLSAKLQQNAPYRRRNPNSMNDTAAENILNPNIPINVVTDNANLDAQAKIIPNINIVHEDRNGIDVSLPENAIRIQNRLDNCYILESLYLRKHNELIDMFKFATLLYNKFNYTLRILLYVLSLLTEHECIISPPTENDSDSDSTNKQNPILINMPKTIIPNIKTLITEQKTMLDTINSVSERINRPINTTEAGVPNVSGLDGDTTDDAINKMFPPTHPRS